MSNYSISKTPLLTTEEFLRDFKYPCFAIMKKEGNEKKGKVIHYFQEYKRVKDKLKQMNTVPSKSGIFFTPNGEYLDKGKRQKTLGSKFHYLVLDFDKVNNEKRFIDSLSLVESYYDIDPARFIVKTGGGYHVYYKFKKPLLQGEEGLSLYKYKQLVIQIVTSVDKIYNDTIGDKSTTDISRIFRLPGYKYWKDNKGEIEISVVSFINNDGIDPLSILKMMKQDGDFIKENKVKEDSKKQMLVRYKDKEDFDKAEKYYKEINEQKIIDVVNRLGYKVCNNTSICDNVTGEVSDGWKVCIHNNYVNNFTESKSFRAVGEPWPFVLTHFKSNRDAAKAFFKKEFNISYPKGIEEVHAKSSDSPIYVEDNTSAKILMDEASGVTVVIDKKNKCMQFDSTKKKVVKLSNFYIEPIAMIFNDDNTQEGTCLIKLVGEFGNSQTINMPIETTPSQFAKVIRANGAFVMYDCPRRILDIIVEDVFREVSNKKIYYNNSLGFNSRNNFIGGDFACIYNNRGDHKIIMPEDKQPIYDNEYYKSGIRSGKIPSDNHLMKSIDVKDISEDFFINTTIEESQRIIIDSMDVLKKIYEKRIMYPLALISIVGLLTPFFRRNHIPIPYGFLFGITQSGKTTISDIVRTRFIQNKYDKLSAMSTTMVPLQEAMKNGLPIYIGEYRASDKYARNRVSGMIRDLYDGTSTRRGMADLKTVKYDMVGTMIIDGEHLIEDPATFSRGIFLHCRNSLKKNIREVHNIKPIFFHMTNLIYDKISNAEDRGKDFWHDEFTPQMRKNSEKIAEKLKDIYSEESSRVSDSYGLLLTIAEIIGYDFDYIFDSIEGSIRDHLERISGKGAKRSMLWELAGYIRHAADDDPTFLNCYSYDGNLFINIEIFTITSFLRIHKKMDPNDFNIIIESFRGERGVSIDNGRMTLATKFFNDDPAILEAIVYCINQKKSRGELCYTKADSEVKEYMKEKANKLVKEQMEKAIKS